MIELPPGTWWPAAEGEAHAFHWRCRCGLTHDAWLSRSVDVQGIVGSALRCTACGFEDAARLVGWDADAHWPRPGPPPRPVRHEMRHRCGTTIRLDELSALALAHDPRSLRGHWCPTCQRHGWNHEWVWVGTEEVVGEGMLGRVRYADLSEEERRRLETHHPIPPELRGSPR
jgi:hypothetical protein